MEKESHQLIGKTILILNALLFSVVLIMTLLTMLSYSEPNQFVGAANESFSDDPEKRSTGGFRRPLLNENEHNLIKEDKNLSDFLATLTGLLIKESQQNVDQVNRKEFNLTHSPSNSTSFSGRAFSEALNLEQDWQKNSLDDALAQRLSRVQPEGDYVTVDGVPVDYEVVDSKNYRLPKRQVEDSTYSDSGYYDQYLNNGKSENTVEVYHDQRSADYQDGGQVQYYLIRKEHNQINLASQHEVRGLNELINRALAKQDHQPKYPPVHVNIPPLHRPNSPPPHQPNIFVFPSSGQPATIIQPSNIVQQQPSHHPPTRNHHYPPYGENFLGWSPPHPPLPPLPPLKKLTLKQKVKFNVCERMLRRVYPPRMHLPFYR